MENPYNQVPYQSLPFPQAHISRLASRGVLMGVDPPDLRGCRVLELGCGDGSHLIPMALQFPESQFVGIDLAEMPIARAQDLVSELGLENISFRVSDVMQLGGQPGECDYLIAHGLYSWVPPAAQEKTLELCGRLLADRGIAYVSYNAYPAWHVREMTRAMALMQGEGLADPVELRNRAIALLAAIYRSQGEREPYRETVRAEMERIIAKEAFLCYHDDFGEYNQPVYFSEFMKRASAHGLQYLSEADLTDFDNAEFAPDAREAMMQMDDPIQREQFYDFLSLRGFRRTLLCRNDVALDRTISLASLKKLFYSAQLECSSSPLELVTQTPFEFQAPSGASVTVNQPFVKAVLYDLMKAWPATMRFEELLDKARSVSAAMSDGEAETMLREVLIRMLVPGLMEASPLPWTYPPEPSDKPLASVLARLQVRKGSPRLTSLRHRAVDLEDPVARAVLPLLDGSRSQEELQSSITAMGHDIGEESIRTVLKRLNDLALLAA